MRISVEDFRAISEAVNELVDKAREQFAVQNLTAVLHYDLYDRSGVESRKVEVTVTMGETPSAMIEVREVEAETAGA